MPNVFKIPLLLICDAWPFWFVVGRAINNFNSNNSNNDSNNKNNTLLRALMLMHAIKVNLCHTIV